MSATIDLIADLGEAFGSYRMANDQALLQIVSSANVACGFHAGDPRVMEATAAACAKSAVAIGAHPGFNDLVGFGRRIMDLTRHEVMTDVLYQIGALSGFASRHGLSLQHVTPHGRLGNMTYVEEKYAIGVVEAVASFNPSLIVMGAESELLRQARAAGLRVAVIGFADRAYEENGIVVDRRLPGAVISDPRQVVDRVLQMVETGTVTAHTGVDVEIACDTILVHGDTPGAVVLAQSVRQALNDAGIAVAPMANSV